MWCSRRGRAPPALANCVQSGRLWSRQHLIKQIGHHRHKDHSEAGRSSSIGRSGPHCRSCLLNATLHSLQTYFFDGTQVIAWRIVDRRVEGHSPQIVHTRTDMKRAYQSG